VSSQLAQGSSRWAKSLKGDAYERPLECVYLLYTGDTSYVSNDIQDRQLENDCMYTRLASTETCVDRINAESNRNSASWLICVKYKDNAW